MPLVISLGLTGSGCAHVPDVPVCVKISEVEGYCSYTVRDSDYSLTGGAWAEVEKNSLRVPIDSWGEIKGFILKICKQTNQCDVNSLSLRLEDVESKLWIHSH